MSSSLRPECSSASVNSNGMGDANVANVTDGAPFPNSKRKPGGSHVRRKTLAACFDDGRMDHCFHCLILNVALFGEPWCDTSPRRQTLSSKPRPPSLSKVKAGSPCGRPITGP